MQIDAEVASLKTQASALAAALEKLEELVAKIQDRPPVWTTWVMTVGGGVIGALVTWLITCLK